MKLKPALEITASSILILAAAIVFMMYGAKATATPKDEVVEIQETVAEEQGTKANVHVILENGMQVPIQLVDQNRAKDRTAIYTTAPGAEFTKKFNDQTVEYVIANGIVAEVNTDGSKGTYIPSDGYVLSATGTAKALLRNLSVGQTIRLENLNLPVQLRQYFTLNGTTVPIGKINGGRIDKEVVLYQPSWGPSTNTNSWGMEIAVDNGVVKEVTEFGSKSIGNDTAIPEHGYVLSIPSNSDFFKKFEKQQVKVGDAVTIVLKGESPYDINKYKFEGTNLPRGGEQTILYNSSFGKSTGTNEWGYEIVVNKDHRVTALGGDDLEIPDGGFVLSSNGEKAEWLKKHVRIGSRIDIDASKMELKIMFNPTSYLDRAKIKINNVSQGLTAAKKKFLDVPYTEIKNRIKQAESLYTDLTAAVANKDYNRLSAKMTQFDPIIDAAGYMNLESRKVEHRGLWLWPEQTNAEQVKEAVAKIAAANINQVYLSTYFDGYTIYPSTNPLIPHNPRFKDFDLLQAYIDECKKYNIEVHAWVTNFFHGTRKQKEKPEWAMVSRTGKKYQFIDNTAMYWLNPALPEVQDMVAADYKQLVQKYDIAGLHLDYIRYPDSFDTTNDYGYDVYTRKQFMKKYHTNVDPIKLYPGHEKWKDWVQFRVDIINKFEERVVRELKPIKPGVAISAAVYPDFDHAPEYKMQDVKAWSAKNQIDNILPMSYTLDVPSIVKVSKRAMDIAGDKSYVTMGLGPQAGVVNSVLVQQVDATNRSGASGNIFFSYTVFFANHFDTELKLGPYRDKAVIPYSNSGLSVKILLENMIRKMEAIYVPNGGMKESRNYAKEIGDILRTLGADGKLNQGSAASVKKGLHQLFDHIVKDASLNRNVKERMQYDVNYCIKIINIYLNKANAVWK